MNILVLNCGSSSLKFQLIETSADQIANNTDRLLARGSVERIGSSDAKLSYAQGSEAKEEKTAAVRDHEEAICIALENLTSKNGVLKEHQEIDAVGHRVVHGGDIFRESVLIDEAVLHQIESLSELAPLHNPLNLKGYYASRDLFPKAKQAAVFDTAFHQTLAPRAFLYGIPYHYYERDKIRRYGFHGTSYRYISSRFATLKRTECDKLKLIVCHLGNGCSMCAIDRGRSVDTSMGFTPMDGLLMGTRPGEIDPGAVLYLIRHDPKGVDGVDQVLNHQSGLAGITGGGSDMRDLLARKEAGDVRATDAIDVFCYRIIKNIGAYLTVLNGADAIIFTGGIGENASPIRRQICEGLTWLGVAVDAERNRPAGEGDREISAPGSRVPVWVVPTNEELWIARDTFRCATA